MAPTSRGLAIPRRGDVCLIRFDPTVGAEIRKSRPALVIQNDIGNRYSPITIVAAITSQVDPARLKPTDVPVAKGEGGLTVDSVVLLNQIRSIDKRRIVKRLGTVRSGTMRQVDRALLISLGLVDI